MNEEGTIREMVNYCSEIRGRLLGQIVFIEKMIDFYIAKHFCKDDDYAIELVDLLLGDRFVSFESKRSVFDILIKKYNKEYYTDNKSIFEDLTYLQTQRNRYAHLIQDVGEEAVNKFILDKTIGLVKFKEKTEPFWYSREEIIKIENKVKNVYESLYRLSGGEP